MWGSRDRRADRVTCIACGEEVPRSDAREYDKYGDRFDRRDKEFEHLCKACYREQSHQPRQGLEDILVESGAGEADCEGFLETYTELVHEEWEANKRERRGHGTERESKED
jgi:hypothetical protein